MLKFSEKIVVTKLEAARRQLSTAIGMWFREEDAVSVHTLACAAHEVIHGINQHRGGRDLLLDNLNIKDEYRKDWIRKIKKEANFFKHADKDPDPSNTIEFSPGITEMYLMFTVVGVEVIGERLNDREAAFNFWLLIKRPEWLTEKGRININKIPPDNLAKMQEMPKAEFFRMYLLSRQLNRQSS